MTPEQYKAAMKSWLKELIKWQLANPDKDWLTELCNQTQGAGSGGDHPPLPPPKP